MTTRNRQIRSPQAQGSIPPEKIRDAIKARRKVLDRCVAVAAATARIKAIGREIEGCGCEPPHEHGWNNPGAPHFNAYIEAALEAEARREQAWRAMRNCPQCWHLYNLVQERKRLRQERGNARRALALIGRGEMSRRETS